MTTQQIKQALMKAFGVKTTKELKQHLKNTDMRKKAELLHALSVAWNYSSCYRLVDRSALKPAIDSLNGATRIKIAFEAKHGFGTFQAA